MKRWFWRFALVVEWRDLWVGAYWSRDASRLYLLPVPCVGVSIYLGPRR